MLNLPSCRMPPDIRTFTMSEFFVWNGSHFVISKFQCIIFILNVLSVLSHNQLSSIDVSFLRNLVKLQLSHNEITEFPDIKVSADSEIMTWLN